MPIGKREEGISVFPGVQHLYLGETLMSDTTLLQSRPIAEVRIDGFDQRYVTRVQWFLEHELQCSMIPMSDERGGYLIRFPPGTIEEVHMGASTQWTYETVIRFPSGITLKKYTRASLSETQKQRVDLAFPNKILDGPEPPRKTPTVPSMEGG
jgi:hypothetical protein